MSNACWIALRDLNSPDRDGAPGGAADPLGVWALQFTPFVARWHGVWVMEASASLRLWGGLARLVERLRAHAEVAVGVSPSEARARLLTNDPAGDPLAPAGPALNLPLHTLPEAYAAAPVWRRLGLSTWGDLDRLPRAGVVRRWGAGVLDGLDRALGRRPHPLPWIQAPECFDLALDLPQAVEHAGPLTEPMGRLLASLAAWLTVRRQAVAVVRWRFHHDPRREHPRCTELEVGLSQPEQALDGLARLTEERCRQLVWSAPVVRLGLTLEQVVPWQGATGPDLFDAAGPHRTASHRELHWPGLLDRLRARLGPAAVCQWARQDTPLAEAAQRPVVHGVLPRTAEPPPPWAVHQPPWLAWPPQPLAVRQGVPHHQGPLRLLAGPHRVEWCPWPEPAGGADVAASRPVVRDEYLAHSPVAGLVWVARTGAHDWVLLGWMG